MDNTVCRNLQYPDYSSKQIITGFSPTVFDGFEVTRGNMQTLRQLLLRHPHRLARKLNNAAQIIGVLAVHNAPTSISYVLVFNKHRADKCGFTHKLSALRLMAPRL